MSARKRQFRGPLEAFTLVELLVVIAIIGLLLAVLVPSLGQARALGWSTLCRHNLKQMWEIFHVPSSRGEVRMPPVNGWISAVASQQASRLLVCPADSADRPGSMAVADIWIEQWHCDTLYLVYPLAELMDGASANTDPKRFYQCYPFWTGESQLTVLIGNNLTDPSQVSGCDAGVRITFKGNTVLFEGLRTPTGCRGGSEHAVYQGNTKIMTLMGRNASECKPWSAEVGCFLSSYAMNRLLAPVNRNPGQLVLLDYYKTLADPLADTVGGDQKYLAPRHLGRCNAVFADGGVRNLWPHELDAAQDLWKP